MLQVGRLGCSPHTQGCPVATPQLVAWTRAHFSAFAIISSPLVLSIVPSDENLAPILDIIGNKLAIEIKCVFRPSVPLSLWSFIMHGVAVWSAPVAHAEDTRWLGSPYDTCANPQWLTRTSAWPSWLTRRD
jgi:hypothetical protein